MSNHYFTWMYAKNVLARENCFLIHLPTGGSFAFARLTSEFNTRTYELNLWQSQLFRESVHEHNIKSGSRGGLASPVLLRQAVSPNISSSGNSWSSLRGCQVIKEVAAQECCVLNVSSCTNQANKTKPVNEWVSFRRWWFSSSDSGEPAFPLPLHSVFVRHRWRRL